MESNPIFGSSWKWRFLPFQSPFSILHLRGVAEKYTENTEKVKVIQNAVTAWNTSRATQSKEAKDVFDINLTRQPQLCLDILVTIS